MIENKDQLIASISTIMILFIIGFAIKRKGLISENSISEFSSLIVGILLPLYLFHATSQTVVGFTGSTFIPITAGVLLTLVACLVAYGVFTLFPEKSASRKKSFIFSNMYTNTAFLGIPICTAIFGIEGTLFAVLYDFGTGLVILTLGIWILSKDERTASIVQFINNPLMWGVIGGVIVGVYSINMPLWISSPLDAIGSATLPLAILICGMQIGSIKLSAKVPIGLLSRLLTLRFVAAPIIAFAGAMVLGVDSLTAAIIVLASAMPVGLSTVMFSKKYGADSDFAAMATVTSTFFSILFLPILIYLLIISFQ